MNEYEVIDFDSAQEIIDRASGYRLRVRDSDIGSNFGPIYFYVSKLEDRRYPLLGQLVTGRSFEDYVALLGCMEINPELQYVDVGAGFSGFVPGLVSKFGEKLKHRPIIIDPVNYGIMTGLFEFALKSDEIGSRHKEKIAEFIERIGVIRDTSKVWLINKTLGKALKEHPEIIGCADRVIDIGGPTQYVETETRSGVRPIKLEKAEQRIKDLEDKLLKPGLRGKE